MRKQTNKRNLMPLLKRVLGIMLREYKVQFGLVVVLILGAALAILAALVLLCAAGYMLVGVHFDNAKLFQYAVKIRVNANLKL